MIFCYELSLEKSIEPAFLHGIGIAAESNENGILEVHQFTVEHPQIKGMCHIDRIPFLDR